MRIYTLEVQCDEHFRMASEPSCTTYNTSKRSVTKCHIIGFVCFLILFGQFTVEQQFEVTTSESQQSVQYHVPMA
jgi:hypothetical protein